MQNTRHLRGLWIPILGILLVLLTSPATAQTETLPTDGRGEPLKTGEGDQVREHSRSQLQDGARQLDRDRIRDQIRGRIDAAPGLNEGQSAEMRANLDALLGLGVDVQHLGAVFPDGTARRELSAHTMLRLQNRVMTAAREGLAVEPVLAKIQEGRTKGVPDPTLERACERLEIHARTAKRIMAGLSRSGIAAPGDEARNRRMQGEIAQHMWRGMDEPGYDQLRERARERRRDGECDAEDVVAAGELGTRLIEAGVDRGRAIDFAGAALQHGYRHQELRQIQVMVAARHQRGEPVDELLGGMEHCVGAGMGPGEMYSYMIRHGWMGPGDMYGPGGNQPVDPKGHGGGNDPGSGGNDNEGKRHGGGHQGG